MADPTLRIIDANANRSREALRVMEDAVRFALDDRDLTERLKGLRHDLAAALAPLSGAGLLIAARDTPGDVGLDIATPAESARASLADVATAAGKRLTEALRSIEEAAKAIPASARTDPSLAPAIEAIRYRAYDLEKSLSLALLPLGRRFTGLRCCVLLTESLCRLDPLETAQRAIEGGADAIQLREKDLDDRRLLQRARELVALAEKLASPTRARAAIIINDRPDIALLAGADGVHLGQNDLPLRDVRSLAAGRLLIGVSTARLDEAKAALAGGADYCGVGPMFQSATKPKPALAGPDYLHEYLAHSPPLPPALAISGVSTETIPRLRAAADDRAFGVAVSSAVCAAADPAEAVRAILASLGALGPASME